MADIDKVREQLWAAVRARQAEGREVRNELMAERFGGQGGYMDGGHEPGWSGPLCLLGALGVPNGLSMSAQYEWAAKLLGLEFKEAVFLESGFEGWSNMATTLTRHLTNEQLTAHPIYQLARSVGEELEKAEELKHAEA